jgi:hypothetical protein
MKIINLLFLIVFVSVFIRCNTKNDDESIRDLKSQEFGLTVIAKGELYGNGDEGFNQENIVVTTKKQWKALISKMSKVNDVTQSFNETDIDFSEYRVVAVFDKVRGSGGYYLQVTSKPESGKIIIDIVHGTPAGAVTLNITQPYFIGKIPVSDMSVVFKDDSPMIYNR